MKASFNYKKNAKEKMKKRWTVPQATRKGSVQVVCGMPKNQEFSTLGKQIIQLDEKIIFKLEF